MRRRTFLAVGVGIFLLAGLQGSASPTDPAGYFGKFVWSKPEDARFGGFSAINVAADGLAFVALSDRGGFLTGRFTRNDKGRISGISASPVALLKGQTEAPLVPSRADSEGLAVAADGTTYVSFEGVARVLRYKRLGGFAENLPDHPDFAQLQKNSALETLAIDGQGTLYTIPERSGGERAPFPVYRFRKGKWDKTLSIPRSGGFLVVDADVGPDGRFYVLERRFLGLAGFGSRLRRFDMGKTLTGEKVLMEAPGGLYDNLEGLSVWRDSAGQLRATMISDDNFNPLLVTAVVEYRLPD